MEVKPSVIANTDSIAVSGVALFLQRFQLFRFWPRATESCHLSLLSPVILQGNGRGLPIDLELLDSRGRVGGLHHDPGLLVSEGGPLGCQGGLLRGDSAHASGGGGGIASPQALTVGCCCCC